MIGSDTMEYIKTFNSEEKEIQDICASVNVDYERIDYLLKHGADANAVEIRRYENNTEDDEELLLMQCLLDGTQSQRFDEEESKTARDLDFGLKLIELFIDNGLDVDKYINQIFGEIQFTYDQKNFIDITKLLLNHLKDKSSLNLDVALKGIGIEESYNNCVEVDHRYANVLATIYEMIENYPDGKDPNKYFNCDHIAGQKIKDIQIYCKDMKIDMANKFITDEIEILIQCDKDRLDILNHYIFVNNNEISSEFEKIDEENNFKTKINEYLKDETIEKIDFQNVEIWTQPKTRCNCTKIEILISNNKKLTITSDESLCFMKILLT